MASYRLAPRAEGDLENIWLYTLERWSQNQADNYYADLITAFEKLANGEKKGRSVDIRQGYLKYSVGSHFIFYRHSDTGIDVIRVLHQSMDVERHL